ncbi:hypothetical protein CORC01_04971 [Colletotrichum orchidophilum]|uniref:DUF1214 domain-containing protein n=1 Tax=Colletotrichum orchidophilum TaxID=1209926 RepID=A0A1G4BE03_9PEZI|nr:uncharacterized protein CORC01_04971 [Colletotrichum orchidophilum]OHE99613.1 hypothetical protein CORC01_04971 [Colletotrichum orchidophilum]
MVLVTLNHLLLLFSLSNIILAAEMLIGYRRVSRAEADLINQYGNIFRDEAYDKAASENGGAQLGAGVYLSLSPKGYNAYNNDWWCWVLAQSKPFTAAPKVWIPRSEWDKDEEKISAYTQDHLKEGETSTYAIRMAQVKDYSEGTWQILIPTRMVQEDKLDTRAECVANYHDMWYTKAVSFEHWYNIRNA